MKQLFSLCILAGVMVFVSCENSENSQLKKRIVELEAFLPQKMDLAPMDTTELEIRLGEFNNSTGKSIVIPTSWQLEGDTLKAILSRVGANGDSVRGVMLYPIKEADGYMKLALIPYYKNGNQLKHFNKSELGAYNYSNMCPPNTNCATSDGEFGAAQAESVWTRQ